MKRKFWEVWADTETANSKLAITILGLLLVVVVLASALFKVATKSREIYYIPGAERAGVSFPGEIPEESITGFAERFVLTLANFTPKTINQVYEKIEKYLEPKLLTETEVGLDDEIARVKKDLISSLYSIDSPSKVIKISGGYKIEITGRKAVYMGKEKLNERTIIYTIYLKKTSPTEVNPYGFLVEGINQKEIEE